MSSGRFALLIASTNFDDKRLRRLVSPSHDVEQLAAVLSDEHLGGYSVDTCVDLASSEVRRRLNRFFRDRDPNDLLLLYVSTHGLKDESNNLYFATPDTSLDEVQSTTFESSFIHRLSRGCRARRQVFVVDACFSGAFGREWGAKDGDAVRKEDLVGTAEPAPFEDDRGLVVFTASTSYQFSFEGSQIADSVNASVFTKNLIEGVRTGKADLDGNGVITEDELYRYAYSTTRSERPSQTPQRWVIGAVGEVMIARSNVILPVSLPDEVMHALESVVHHVRIGAIGALMEFAASSHKGRAATAVRLLVQLAESDDSRAVRSAATEALQKLPRETEFPREKERHGQAGAAARTQTKDVSTGRGAESQKSRNEPLTDGLQAGRNQSETTQRGWLLFIAISGVVALVFACPSNKVEGPAPMTPIAPAPEVVPAPEVAPAAEAAEAAAAAAAAAAGPPAPSKK